jgi:hypothetical protein
MNKRGIVTFAVSFTFAAIAFAVAPSTIAHAESLAQATNTEKINYEAVISDSDIALLKTIFDAEFYAQDNPKVVEIIGNDPEALFKHWIKSGIFEGRPGNAIFDPSAYAALNPALREAFGTNVVAYYLDYINSPTNAGKTFTIADCINNHIPVTSVVDNDIVITEQVYWVAQYLGTSDYRRINYHIDAAETTGSSEEVAADGTTITLKRNEYGEIEIYVNNQRTSYGAYMQLSTDTTSTWELVAGEDVKAETGAIEVAYGSIRVQSDSSGNNVHSHFSSNASSTMDTVGTNITSESSSSGCIWDIDNAGTADTQYTIDIEFQPTYENGVIKEIDMTTSTTGGSFTTPIENEFDITLTDAS